MRRIITTVVGLIACSRLVIGADSELPIVPEGFVVDIVAREPLVSNPCVMAFDRRGRIFIGQGQQWRAPVPETPGDRVDILVDDNGDGVADRTKTFAEGFNCIQGLAWKGNDLWVANAPDLTIVRDLDGDDEADEYVRMYTGLGNLEHALHGLNFGPDGKLYMSKGNSKGYNRLDQLAPKAFRELWGLPSPPGAPDYTPVEVFKRGEYRKKYHTPPDDWGQQGGILRCDPDGRNLEVISRGFRNPWDITFDDGFDWLGTDNDQTQGDKIFAPFYGSHFGWGHAWSYHWTGERHLPTVPASTPLFKGSGAGVIHYHAAHFPPEYSNLFFVNDWMRREVYLFRPQWSGALMKCEGGFPSVFAHAGGGRSLPAGSGRVFEPTDIEVGPDGALYILSWGHAYGATIVDGRQVDAGRVYRIRYADNPLVRWNSSYRELPLGKWTLDNLFSDLGSHVPAWRTYAQDELVRRSDTAMAASRRASSANANDPIASFLLGKLDRGELTKAETTWTLWTLGRLSLGQAALDERFATFAGDANADENTRIQALRISAFRFRQRVATNSEQAAARQAPLDLPAVESLLRSSQPRLRHETVQMLWQTNQRRTVGLLLDRVAKEQDRVVFYTTWHALRELASIPQRKEWLRDERGGVRLAALLGLCEEGAVSVDEVVPLQRDADERVAAIANLWLEKTGGAKPIVTMDPPPGDYMQPTLVSLKTTVPRAVLTYTLDGSLPVNTSPRYTGPILIDRNATLRVAVAQAHTQAGRVTTGKYRIRRVEPYRHRAFISHVHAQSGGAYRMDWTGLAAGKRHYTDRTYHITGVPEELRGLPYLQTFNGDDRSSGDAWLSMTSDSEVMVYVGVDVRVNAPLAWMKIGQPGGFEDTGLQLVTTDPTFRVYRKRFAAGQIVLGGSTNHSATDSGRGHYVVIFDRPLLNPQANARPVSTAEVLAAFGSADPERGRELFLHPRGAGCFKCHQMEGRGAKFGPDLTDIGSRAKRVETLVESILNPSAVITEGFAQQHIITADGKTFIGAVLEETGRTLKIVDSESKVTTIAKSNIEARRGRRFRRCQRASTRGSRHSRWQML